MASDHFHRWILDISLSQGRSARSDMRTVCSNPTKSPGFPPSPGQEWWSCVSREDLSALGSSASHWVTWKPPLSLLVWVSIFSLKGKKITALIFGCIEIYGAGWFPGCCSCRALLRWCMTGTCHQCSQALMIHCSNKSFVIHHCPSSGPHPGPSWQSSGESWLETSPVLLPHSPGRRSHRAHR